MKLYTLAALVYPAAMVQAQTECDKVIDGNCIFSDVATTVQDEVFGTDDFADVFCGDQENVMGDSSNNVFPHTSDAGDCPDIGAIVEAACQVIGDDLLFIEHGSTSAGLGVVANDAGTAAFTMGFAGTTEFGAVAAGSDCNTLITDYSVDMTFVTYSPGAAPLVDYNTVPGSFLLRCNAVDVLKPTLYAVEPAVGATTGAATELSLSDRLAFLATVREGLVETLKLPFPTADGFPADMAHVIVGKDTDDEVVTNQAVEDAREALKGALDDFNVAGAGDDDDPLIAAVQTATAALEALEFTAPESGLFCYIGTITTPAAAGVPEFDTHHASVCIKMEKNDKALCTRQPDQTGGPLPGFENHLTFRSDRATRYLVSTGAVYTASAGIASALAGPAEPTANDVNNFCVFVAPSDEVKALNTDVAVGCATDTPPTLTAIEGSSMKPAKVASLFEVEMVIKIGSDLTTDGVTFRALADDQVVNVFRTGNGLNVPFELGFGAGDNFPRVDLVPAPDDSGDTKALVRVTYKTGTTLGFYKCEAEVEAFDDAGDPKSFTLTIQATDTSVLINTEACTSEEDFAPMALPTDDAPQLIQLPAFSDAFGENGPDSALAVQYGAFSIEYFRPETPAPTAAPSSTPTAAPTASPIFKDLGPSVKEGEFQLPYAYACEFTIVGNDQTPNHIDGSNNGIFSLGRQLITSGDPPVIKLPFVTLTENGDIEVELDTFGTTTGVTSLVAGTGLQDIPVLQFNQQVDVRIEIFDSDNDLLRRLDVYVDDYRTRTLLPGRLRLPLGDSDDRVMELYVAAFGISGEDFNLVPAVDGSRVQCYEITASPTASPSVSPSTTPTASPTASPSTTPTASPSTTPTASPTASPSTTPTASPTGSPSTTPTDSPSAAPTGSPSASPTASPTGSPTGSPSASPTASPSVSPTGSPSVSPTGSPSASPTASPSVSPSAAPTGSPSASPTASPTGSPSASPSASPTASPSVDIGTLDAKCDGVNVDLLVARTEGFAAETSRKASHVEFLETLIEGMDVGSTTAVSFSTYSNTATSVSTESATTRDEVVAEVEAFLATDYEADSTTGFDYSKITSAFETAFDSKTEGHRVVMLVFAEDDPAHDGLNSKAGRQEVCQIRKAQRAKMGKDANIFCAVNNLSSLDQQIKRTLKCLCDAIFQANAEDVTSKASVVISSDLKANRMREFVCGAAEEQEKEVEVCFKKKDTDDKQSCSTAKRSHFGTLPFDHNVLLTYPKANICDWDGTTCSTKPEQERNFFPVEETP